MGKRKSQKAVREKALDGANNPVVRAVIAKIPAVGSVLNDAMADKRSRLAEERFGTFIDEL
jgi:hypothetical protein